MEGLTAFSYVGGGRLPLRSPSTCLKRRSYHRRSSHLRVYVAASREGPELDKWDQMELKFGKLLGEDPKLTLAKIMAKKANPDVSYLEVEKSFYKNKGKLDESMFNASIDVNVDRQPTELPSVKNLNLSRPVMNKSVADKSSGGLNLSRPVMNKGVNSTADLSLSRPVLSKGVKIARPAVQNEMPQDIGSKSSTPNVALRKPDVAQEDDLETDKRSKIKLKPNLFLKMRKGTDENLSDVSLLKKPEVMQKPLSATVEKQSLGGPIQSSSTEILLDKPEMIDTVETSDNLGALDLRGDNIMVTNACDSPQGSLDSIGDSVVTSSKLDELETRLQPSEQRDVISRDVEASSTPLDEKAVNCNNDVSQQTSLIGRPRRLDPSAKVALRSTEKVTPNSKEEDSDDGKENMVSEEQEEREASDWKKVEDLFHRGERAEVELVSCTSKGFIVSFGSLVGFLPYRNLGAKWKFLAFESWLRKKGLDPSQYRQDLSIIGNYDASNKNLIVGSDSEEMGKKDEETLSPGLKFEDLLEAYDKEKIKFLSSFVGQILKVSVLLADRNSRRLIFSGRPKEKEELVEKKRSVMANLNVGDVVKCCIKKITYFGIFVEVEGVPALIHQSEISWDATLDPSSYYKIGQIVEAKVYQLDYALERISLSLKEITPDPLMEALESVVGDCTSLESSLEAPQAEIEPWADVESLIEELQQIDGVLSVSKGRYFLSPGLAPTFQVYMASVLDNQYKLLARYGNKVQEVIVQASLDKEEMKAAILACTNRVQ